MVLRVFIACRKGGRGPSLPAVILLCYALVGRTHIRRMRLRTAARRELPTMYQPRFVVRAIGSLRSSIGGGDHAAGLRESVAGCHDDGRRFIAAHALPPAPHRRDEDPSVSAFQGHFARSNDHVSMLRDHLVPSSLQWASMAMYPLCMHDRTQPDVELCRRAVSCRMSSLTTFGPRLLYWKTK